MKLVANRFELFNAMINRKYMTLNMNGKNYNCYINAIEMEDGSGYNFNVRVYIPMPMAPLGGEYHTVFVSSK